MVDSEKPVMQDTATVAQDAGQAIKYTDPPVGVRAYNVYEDGKVPHNYGDQGPEPERTVPRYPEDQVARWRQGPPRYDTTEDALIALINRLEADSMYGKWMLEDSDRAWGGRFEALRTKNTEAEKRAQDLSNFSAGLKVASDSAMKQLERAVAMNGELVLVNKRLEDRINNQAEVISKYADDTRELIGRLTHATAERDAAVDAKTGKQTIEYLFRRPDHDMGITEFVQQTDRWQIDTFAGAATEQDNAMALVEEAIEVGQVYGLPLGDVLSKAASVYRKPTGSMMQELGGVAITWAGLVARSPLAAISILTEALNDCWRRQDEIRQKKGIVRAVGKGKMVPGALKRLAAEGISLNDLPPNIEPVIHSPGLTGAAFPSKAEHFGGKSNPPVPGAGPVAGKAMQPAYDPYDPKSDPRVPIPTASPFRDRPDFNSAIVDERKPYEGDPFAAAEAQGKEDLANHVASTRVD